MVFNSRSNVNAPYVKPAVFVWKPLVSKSISVELPVYEPPFPGVDWRDKNGQSVLEEWQEDVERYKMNLVGQGINFAGEVYELSEDPYVQFAVDVGRKMLFPRYIYFPSS